MIKWLETKRNSWYRDMVTGIPSMADTKVGACLARLRSGRLRNLIVHLLKPTKCYRVYQEPARPQDKWTMMEAVTYRWGEKNAFYDALAATLTDCIRRAIIIKTRTFISNDGLDTFPILRQIEDGDDCFEKKLDTDDIFYAVEHYFNCEWYTIDLYRHGDLSLKDIIRNTKHLKVDDVHDLYRVMVRIPGLPHLVAWKPAIVPGRNTNNYFDTNRLAITSALYLYAEEEIKVENDGPLAVGSPLFVENTKFWVRDIQYRMDGVAETRLTTENPHD